MPLAISARQLKWIALSAMVLDHLAFFFPDVFPLWFRYIGRLAAPLFIWLVVVNSEHTRNWRAYFSRLLGWGAFMLAGSTLLVILTIYLKGSSETYLYGFGIFFSLAVTAAVALAVRTIENAEQDQANRILAWASLPLLAVTSFYTEGGLYIFCISLCFAVFRRNLRALALVFVALNALLIMQYGLYSVDALLSGYQWMAIACIPFLFLTSKGGTKPPRWEKFFFYAFYPAHVWVLYVIATFVVS